MQSISFHFTIVVWNCQQKSVNILLYVRSIGQAMIAVWDGTSLDSLHLLCLLQQLLLLLILLGSCTKADEIFQSVELKLFTKNKKSKLWRFLWLTCASLVVCRLSLKKEVWINRLSGFLVSKLTKRVTSTWNTFWPSQPLDQIRMMRIRTTDWEKSMSEAE